MRFNNPQAIKDHPASLIPYNVFTYFFNMYDFPDYLFSIMTADNTEMDEALSKNSLLIKSQHNGRYQVWLAIAYSHPDLSNIRLLEIARFLSLGEQEILHLASLFGNLSFFNDITESLENIRDQINAQDFKAFREASRGGHLPVIDRLIQLAPADVQNMFNAGDFEAFRNAACGGHLPVIDRLIQLAPADVQNMVNAGDFEAFRNAACGGHLPVIDHLIQLAPADVKNMIHAENFQAFRAAAYGGHLAVIERLIQLVPAEVPNMIEAQEFGAFRVAACGGHLAVIDRLMQLAPADVQNMIKAQDFEAFRNAACGGHLPVIERLMELVPANEVQNMIKAKNFQAFRLAAENGHLPVIERLMELARADVQNIIKADDFLVFREAAIGGHLPVIERLIQLALPEVQNMIKAANFQAFGLAAEGGHLAVIERFIELAPTEVQNMIQAHNFEAFRMAACGGHLAVIERLLSYPIVLAYAEMHVSEYARFVNPFIDEKLGSLRAQKNRLEQQAPNGVFNIIDPNEANLLFYVLRNLIRRNEARPQNGILFLLNIPSVGLLAHSENNELLRLAMASHNQEAIGLLLNIPAVLQLAEANEFYRDEARGGINLRELAQNRESSMTVLSQGEQNRLKRAIDHYKPMIDTSGVANIMTELRETLAARYETHPAMFVRQGQTCILPLQWTAFQALELNQEERSAAMAAYAKHKDHTAWRYLSKPNPWMHQDAALVNVDPATHEMWSTFEEYQPVICLYYLAAIDSQCAPTDGYTIETRLEGFIDELALIARAHNWDKKRFKINKDGNPVMEEYDDLEGDRPSCYSGVPRRLFQSVRGHPLLNILTKSIIDAELRGLILSHLRKSVNPENRSAIHSAWDKIISLDKLTQDDIAVLTSLNISEEKQGQFIGYLRDKYQEQFTEDPSFLVQIKKKFFLKENEFHVQNFGHCLMDFFEETGSQVPLSEVGIFGKTQALKKDHSHAILPQALQELALGLLILGGVLLLQPALQVSQR